MPVWETLLLRENNSLGAGDSGDIDIKLPENRAIHKLLLTIRNQNGSTSNTDDAGALETVVNSITELKVQSGSRIFKEFSGQACRDWATYKTGRNPHFFNTQIAGSTYPTGWQEAVFPIDFGRANVPYDTVCGLPTPLYKQNGTELKIKYDFTVDNADGFVTGKHKFDLVAEVMPIGTDLKGMQVIEQRKKIEDTSAASGVEPYDLTIDPVKQLRQVMILCYETGIAEGVDVSKVSLDVDSAEVCVDDWNRWQWQNATDCRLKFEQIIDSVYLDDTSHVLYTEIPNVQPLMCEQDTGIAGYLTTAGDQVTIAGAASAGENVSLAMKSDVIPRCVFLDFDKDSSMRNMISQDKQDIVIHLTHGGADGAIEIHEMSIVPA
jgi:hypothetical protein